MQNSNTFFLRIMYYFSLKKEQKIAKRSAIFNNFGATNSTECLPYLHAQAGFGSSKGQDFDFYSLSFAHNIGDVGDSSLSPKLRDVDQALPTLPGGKTNGWA